MNRLDRNRLSSPKGRCSSVGRALWILMLALLWGSPLEAGVPARIVSLAPGLTECLFALGAGPSVVGVTDFDRFPAEVRELPSVGGYYDPSLERVLALSPDLVVGIPTFHGPLLDRLDDLGVPTLRLSLHRRLEQVRRALDELGKVVGAGQRATELWENITAGLERQKDRIARAWCGMPPSLLVVVWTDPLTVAGGVNYLDEILDSLGVVNAAGEIEYSFPQVDREKVLALDPDVVIVARATEGMVLKAEDFLKVFAGLPLRAVREGHVTELPADVLFHPGPRVLQAAELLGNLLIAERTGEDDAPQTKKRP